MTNQKRYLTRLTQTQYHFKNMKEKVKTFPFDEFAFELCAFIESARNITFALQKEHANNPKFKEWYNKKQEEMRKDELLKFFIEKRNTIVKEGDPGNNAFTFYLEGRLTLPPFEEVGVILTDGIFTLQGEIKAKTKTGIEIPMEKKIIRTPVFPELKSRHVIDACQEYLDKLEALINESQQNI